MIRKEAIIDTLISLALYGGIVYLIAKFAGITYALSALFGMLGGTLLAYYQLVWEVERRK